MYNVLEIFTVVFFGHKYIDNPLKVEELPEEQIRNREMVDRADLVICYIEYNEGGAYKTMKYALERDKAVINLSSIIDF